MIRTLLVDDEPPGRQGLRTRLEATPGFELVGEACDGAEAVERILELRPDLVFLDIQMPGMDGFEVLARVADTHLPQVVFVTAFDRFALRAFEVHALDYLLKPWSLERFEEAVRRARSALAADDPRPRERVAGLLDAPRPDQPPGPLTRFVVRDRGRFVLLPASDVDWIQAAENYVELHTAHATHLVRHTMKELASRLDPRHYARIHRSLIVRLDAVRDIQPGDSGDYVVTLLSGERLPMSRTHRKALLDRR
ncbi:MAG: LytTR family DNA-binding domain-containing protein [Candidatus Eisenbacteria bacterium]